MKRGLVLVGLSLLAAAAVLAVPCGSALPAAEEEGFRPIFNGKTLEGWDGDLKFWRADEGAVVGETTKDNPTKGNTFLVWRGGQPADFELRIEWKLVNHNSGIQFRSWEEPEKWGKWVIGGYQADIADNNFCGILYGERYRGVLANRGEKTVIGEDHKPKVVGKLGDPAELGKAIKKADWNEYRIVAKGNHITQHINGVPMVDVTDDDKQVRRASGLIALQLHAGPPMKVLFRNIRLKEFPKPDNPMKGPDGKTKIVFIAGRPSHGYFSHDHYAGCMLLAKCLRENVKNVETVVYKDGWPKDPAALDGADAIVVFSDGGGGHPMLPHMDKVEPLMKKGVGLACLHYAVEIPKGKAGDQLKDWIGGYFETFWSVNPHWRAEFKQFPKHPVTNGVRPFFMDDEWYYHMRFVDKMEGVTPILSAIPPESTRERPDGSHSGNPTVRSRKGLPEHIGWVRERPDGGRGFGFTGCHWHWSWANDDFRKVVLNGIAWIAKLEIPPEGIPSKTPTLEELEENPDEPPSKNFDRKRVLKLIEEWKQWKP